MKRGQSGKIIRVVMVVQSYSPLVGGAEKQIEVLAPLLMELGVEVSVITRRYPSLKSIEFISGVPVYRMPIPGPKPVRALSFTLFSLFRIAKLQPEIIHAHEMLSPATTAIFARKLLRIPAVVKVLRGGELGDVAKLKKRFLGFWRLKILRDYLDKIIVISNEIEAELLELGFSQEKLFRNPNGVDVDKFSPCLEKSKTALRESLGITLGPVAIFTGRLSAEKNVDQLIKTWPLIRTEYPQAQLLILGEGEESQSLRRLAIDGVHFLGLVDDVVPYLQASDLFVLPSSTEGLSNALLEAMSSGLPSVVTAVGGAPDLIVHKENGWLIPPDSPDLLKEAILVMFGDEKLRMKLGEQARQKIVNEYNLEIVARRLRKLYLSLTEAA